MPSSMPPFLGREEMTSMLKVLVQPLAQSGRVDPAFAWAALRCDFTWARPWRRNNVPFISSEEMRQRQLEWNALIDKYIDDSFEDDDGRSMCDDLSGDAVSTCLSVCACLSVRASLSVCQAMHSYTCKYVSDVVNYISMSMTSNEIILNHTRVNTRMSSRILLWTESLLPSPGRCLQSSHAHTRARICHVLKVCVGGCVGG